MSAKLDPLAAESRRYGWQPDLPDQRDHLFAVAAHVAAKLPAKVDLRPKCAPVIDQGKLGSCTANALANAHLFCQLAQPGGADALPSRLFLYYNERALHGTEKTDSGAQIRDGIKVLAKLGDAPESLWPYDIAKFAQKPPAKVYQSALGHQAVTYQRVTQSLSQIKGALASGFPIAFGFTVYESFQSATVAKSGVAPMPAASERVLGGHAVLAVGYDDAKQVFRVQNSWGTGWGQKGFFTLPYAYLASKELAGDFWTIRLVKE
jgi:C1A family cysteine protease